MAMTIVVAVILVTLIVNNVQCVLLTKPRDAAAKIGDFASMNCSSSDVNDLCGKITWKHFKMNSQSGDYVISGGVLSPSVTSYISLINSAAGHCDLGIKATPSAAGRYQCLYTSDTANAELIVLENRPEVNRIRNSDNGMTDLKCSVNYYGNWAPEVQWAKNVSGSIWSNVTATVTTTDGENSKRSVSSVTQIPTDKFDTYGAREYFICYVKISKSGGSNMPIYNWQSQKKETTYPRDTSAASGTATFFKLVSFLIFFRMIMVSYLSN